MYSFKKEEFERTVVQVILAVRVLAKADNSLQNS